MAFGLKNDPSTTDSAPRPTGVRPGIIDVDVHPVVKGGFRSLLPYLPEVWRPKLEYLAPGSVTVPGPTHFWPHPQGGYGAGSVDTIPPEGGPPGSSVSFLIEDLVDRFDLALALLVSLEGSRTAIAAADPTVSAVIVSAINDYYIDNWLSDRRLRYALLVSPRDPALAAKEIHRHARDSRIAAVLLPVSNARLGNRVYYPIYEAALEYGLPIAVHIAYDIVQPSQLGIPELWAEMYVDIPMVGQACLASLVMHGVFDKYPDLHVLLLEYGFSWVVSHSWRMDKAWLQARKEMPWVKRWPSEYVHDHVKFSTQPLDDPRDDGALEQLIEESLLADTVCFATDYPHFDQDTPRMILKRLSEGTLRKVNYDNARSILRL